MEIYSRGPARPIAFRLRDLPQELRDRIVELALEPRAIFKHCSFGDRDANYSLPTLEHWHDDPGESKDVTDEDTDGPGGPRHWILKFVMETDPNEGDEIKDSHAVLTFKVSMSAPLPLLLVSKDTNTEVRKVLQLTQSRLSEYYTAMIKPMIFTRRIVSPSPVLLDIWSRSRLVLDCNAEESLFFLDNLPNDLTPFVCDVIITRAVYWKHNPPTRAAWAPDDETGGNFFTNFIADKFPNLRTVAFHVPHEREYVKWYWNTAPGYLCTLLEAGRFDTIRYFYVDTRGVVETDDCFLRGVGSIKKCSTKGRDLEDDKVGKTNEDEDEDERKDDDEDQVEAGDLHIVEELSYSTDPKPEIWSCLGANRVVKITRLKRREDSKSVES